MSIVIVEFHFAKMNRDCYLANERYDAPCICCLSTFANVTVLIINRDSSSGVFCLCFTFKVEYVPFVTNIILFIDAFSRLGICLFRYTIFVADKKLVFTVFVCVTEKRKIPK